MHTNYLFFYGNLPDDLNTDSEHLYILSEPPFAFFSQLKPIPFSLRKCVKNIHIFKISLTRE